MNGFEIYLVLWPYFYFHESRIFIKAVLEITEKPRFDIKPLVLIHSSIIIILLGIKITRYYKFSFFLS